MPARDIKRLCCICCCVFIDWEVCVAIDLSGVKRFETLKKTYNLTEYEISQFYKKSCQCGCCNGINSPVTYLHCHLYQKL